MKVGLSQQSEPTFKRKRAVFQKDCKYLVLFHLLLSFLLTEILILFLLNVTVQHMMYGFGDDPNVSVIFQIYFPLMK